MNDINKRLNKLKQRRMMTRYKHLRGRHDQRDHAWNRGMGRGATPAGGGAGGLSQMEIYKKTRQSLLDTVRKGEISRRDVRNQLRELRETISGNTSRREDVMANRAETGSIRPNTNSGNSASNVATSPTVVQPSASVPTPVSTINRNTTENTPRQELFSDADFSNPKDIDSQINDMVNAVDSEMKDWHTFANNFYKRRKFRLHGTFLYAKQLQKYSTQEQMQIADRLIEAVSQGSEIMISDRMGGEKDFNREMLESIGIMGEPEARLYVAQKLMDVRISKAQNAQKEALNTLKNIVNSPSYSEVFSPSSPFVDANTDINEKISALNNIDENNMPDRYDLSFIASDVSKPIIAYLQGKLDKLTQQENDFYQRQSVVQSNRANLSDQEIADWLSQSRAEYALMQEERSKTMQELNQLVKLPDSIAVDFEKLQDPYATQDALSTIAANALEYALVRYPNAKTDKTQRRALFAELIKHHASLTEGVKLAHMHELVEQVGPNKEHELPAAFSFFPSFSKIPTPHPDLVEIFQAEYEETQNYYKSINVTKIPLHRGYKPSGPPRGIPFESWSTDSVVAGGFAKDNEGNVGVVESDNIDVKYLLTDHTLMPDGTFPYKEEFEYVVLGWGYWNSVWRGEQTSIDFTTESPAESSTQSPVDSSEESESSKPSLLNKLQNLFKRLTNKEKSVAYRMKSRVKYQSRIQ